MRLKALIACAALLGLSHPALARMEKTTVHSAAVEGNLEGNTADRTVYVFLPDSYDDKGSRAKGRRYPVIYFLHGYNSTADQYVERNDFDAALKASGTEAIIVVPDSMTKWGGSMYSNSPTVGNFEDFIAQDLVAWTDKHFRTIPSREARGLAGHSMGGYGTLKLGMKRADVFGALYAMNPCCQIPRPASSADPKYEGWSVDQALTADWMSRGNFAVAAAWSPNPGKPPFFADLGTSDGKVNDLVIAKWAANSPVAMASQYLPSLRRMSGIAIDTGDTDFVRADDELIHETLTRFGIAHDWEIYVGDHGNRVKERFRTYVLPFFTKHLKGSTR
ncbi:esterase [Novosphingobium sp. 1Y9A]|uniref:Esterase n=2 Tax=Novosphingobium jiangmenense TaxID=2791981 RepID=A0ABS0HH31_9SPHN|nr:esterase [Novosphingobium jiangmenense]